MWLNGGASNPHMKRDDSKIFETPRSARIVIFLVFVVPCLVWVVMSINDSDFLFILAVFLFSVVAGLAFLRGVRYEIRGHVLIEVDLLRRRQLDINSIVEIRRHRAFFHRNLYWTEIVHRSGYWKLNEQIVEETIPMLKKLKEINPSIRVGRIEDS